MNIKIGEKIKELRKRTDVSQERFAEYLGVTAQAVSRWEVEGCYPDIELLPAIAHFFNVSIDELLCYDAMKSKDKIAAILAQAGPERSKSWQNGTNLEMLRTAVLEFPNSYDLLYCLAKALCYTKNQENEKPKNLQESIAICKRILNDCLDDTLRLRTLLVLSRAYINAGMKDLAVETANRLPSARDSSDMILPDILEGNEQSKQIAKSASLLSDMFEYLVVNLADTKYKDDPERRIDLFKKQLSFEEILHEDGDYIYETLRMRAICYWICEDYMKLGNYDLALDYIEKFAAHSLQFDALPQESSYTSLIFCGQICNKNRDLDIKDTVPGSRIYLTTREIFAPVREMERFKAVIENLK